MIAKLSAASFSSLILALLFQLTALSSLHGQTEEVVFGTEFGDPIQGITAREFELFRLGLEDFLEVESPEEGLGPVWNGRSCAECHAIPRIGGVGNMTEFLVGGLREDGSFQAFSSSAVVQLFSLPPHEAQASMPADANVAARRKPLPLFGDGLVEAVPDETFIAMADPEDLNGDGISGRVNRVFDPETGQMRVGRFGWKADFSSLFTFGALAYLLEMGITNDLFPQEVCPAGVDCSVVELVDFVPDPEDAPEATTGLRGIDNFANFMRLLGPPPRGEITEEAQRGEALFESIQCSSCHVPSLTTGAASFPALSFKRFSPYGDFLLHDIGTGDGIVSAEARAEEIRTAPLWGVRFRAPFLHDGRAATLREAIEMHGGEAAGSRSQFEELSEEDKRALIAFLESL